jgi:hypothetical protein
MKRTGLRAKTVAIVARRQPEAPLESAAKDVCAGEADGDGYALDAGAVPAQHSARLTHAQVLDISGGCAAEDSSEAAA